MPKIAVITSGPSHNLQALLEAHQTRNLKDGDLILVASKSENAFRPARKAGVETLPIADNGAFDGKLADAVASHSPDLIVTLDWPHQFSTEFLDVFPRRVIAVQPALADQFPTGDPIEQAFEAFNHNAIKWSGCNIHYVGPEGTTAEVMRQLVVPIEPKDTLQRFAARMRRGEQWLLLKAVKQYLYELRTRSKRSTSQKKST